MPGKSALYPLLRLRMFVLPRSTGGPCEGQGISNGPLRCRLDAFLSVGGSD